jgi:hypothetical protein
MTATEARATSEQESRKIAEESREKEWAGRTFLRELCLGNFLLDTRGWLWMLAAPDRLSARSRRRLSDPD